MSIAVSVEVKPSRMLAIGFALVFLASFSLIAYSALHYLDALPLSLRLIMPIAWAFIVILAAQTEWHQYRKSLHIDISENGQITVEEDIGINATHRKNHPVWVRETKQDVRLRDDSTLWQSLLLLRLQRSDDSLMSIVILPDSVGEEDFRALRVACRWIAARRERVERKFEIGTWSD